MVYIDLAVIYVKDGLRFFRWKECIDYDDLKTLQILIQNLDSEIKGLINEKEKEGLDA